MAATPERVGLWIKPLRRNSFFRGPMRCGASTLIICTNAKVSSSTVSFFTGNATVPRLFGKMIPHLTPRAARYFMWRSLAPGHTRCFSATHTRNVRSSVHISSSPRQSTEKGPRTGPTTLGCQRGGGPIAFLKLTTPVDSDNSVRFGDRRWDEYLRRNIRTYSSTSRDVLSALKITHVLKHNDVSDSGFTTTPSA